MKNNRLLNTGILVIGILMIIIGYIYATRNAQSLPHYFPGYDGLSTKVHAKHSIAAFALGFLSFIYLWFATGPKKNGN